MPGRPSPSAYAASKLMAAARRAELKRRRQVAPAYPDAFIAMPVRAGWLLHLRKIRSASVFQLGVLLWCIAGIEKSLTFKATGWLLSKYGISSDVKKRGLKKLEAAGLISVEWQGRGVNPIVTILPLAGPEVNFNGKGSE